MFQKSAGLPAGEQKGETVKKLFNRGVVAVLTLGVVLIAGAAVRPHAATGISYSTLNGIQKKLVSGALAETLGSPSTSSSPNAAATSAGACVNPAGGGDESDVADNECAPDSFAAPGGPGGGGGGSPAGFVPAASGNCSETLGDNVKVNQNCENVSDPKLAGRGQAQNEEAIAINPADPSQIVASQNDYRRGDGNCYTAFSSDGGKDWADSTDPMSFTYGTTWGKARQYWQAGGDTSVGWDSRGNAYLMCQVFNRGNAVSINPDQSSGFYVFRSTGNGGASWNFPGHPVAEMVNSDGTALLDKEYMTIDSNTGSTYRDRIYVTWTTFASDGTAYIFEAHSNDFGQSFSAPVLVSADSSLCPFTYGLPTTHGKCNENQDSDPFVGPDGTLYVAYNNFNTATSDTSKTTGDNAYQVMLAKSTDGGATFSAPVQVSPYNDLPDCVTYQSSDPFRACVPETGPSTNSVFRAANYPVGAVNPKKPTQVVVTFGSYINQDSNSSNGCTPTGFNPSTGQPLYDGVKTAGACNNDILISVSNNGGATFSGTGADPATEPSVNPDPNQALSDQWFQWAGFSKNGTFAVDYYDRQYGKMVSPPPSGPTQPGKPKPHPVGVPSDQFYGNSDITLSGSTDLKTWGTSRVTSSSMPPPTQFAGQFYGDYIGMAVSDQAFPIWSDTRDPELFNCPGTPSATAPPQICTGVYSTPQGPLEATDENSYMAQDPIPTK
jgi:hypothetical protein